MGNRKTKIATECSITYPSVIIMTYSRKKQVRMGNYYYYFKPIINVKIGKELQSNTIVLEYDGLKFLFSIKKEEFKPIIDGKLKLLEIKYWKGNFQICLRITLRKKIHEIIVIQIT